MQFAAPQPGGVLEDWLHPRAGGRHNVDGVLWKMRTYAAGSWTAAAHTNAEYRELLGYKVRTQEDVPEEPGAVDLSALDGVPAPRCVVAIFDESSGLLDDQYTPLGAGVTLRMENPENTKTLRDKVNRRRS